MMSVMRYVMLWAGIALLSACASKEAVQSPAAQATRSVIPAPDPDWIASYRQHLRKVLAGTAFEVADKGDETLVITAPADAIFNPDRPSMLLPAALAPLTRVAKLVGPDTTMAVMVLGHGDVGGATAHELSGDRARAVGAIFALTGLRSNRLLIKGVGDKLPRTSKTNRSGRAKNQRVEMVLAPRNRFQLLASYY